MLVNIQDNKLQKIKSLRIRLSKENACLGVETFRLIMLHYSDNQVTDKELYIYYDVECENTAVLRYITIVPELFNSITTTIETQVNNINDLFIEACKKIADQTHLTLKFNLIKIDILSKVIDNIQKIKNDIPEANIVICVEFSNDICKWLLKNGDHLKKLSNISPMIIGSSYYFNFVNKEYYNEDMLTEFFKFYFNHDCSDNVPIMSLYTHLVEKFTSKVYADHSNKSILINSDESVDVIDLDNLITRPTKFNWNNISKSILSDYMIDDVVLGYRSEFTNKNCSECVMKNKCEFYTDKFRIHTISVPKNVCYNKLLVYKVWGENYINLLRQLTFIYNANIQEKLTINREAINILNRLHGGKV